MADEKPEKKPERRVGQRETIIAGKKYRLRVFLCKDPATGKKRYHSETFHGTAGEAEARIREVIRRYRAGEAIHANANADTLGSFLDEFLVAKKLSVTENSYGTYEDVVERRLRPALGKKMLAVITAADVQSFYVKLRDEKLSVAYIRYIHGILSMVFKLAVMRKKLLGSPMVGVLVPKERGEDEDDARARAMSADQVAKFLEAASGHRFENLFRLSFFVGLRPGELRALKWTDFDAEARTLRVSHNIVFRRSGDWYLTRGKTKTSRRTLPLTGAMIEVLRRQRTAQLEDRMKAGKLWTDHNFIFTDPLGEPWAPWTLEKDCKRILAAAGLPPHLSPKVSRHTMASLLIAGGTSPRAVQERLGHSRITTTLGSYAHAMPNEQEDVSEEIERLLDAKK